VLELELELELEHGSLRATAEPGWLSAERDRSLTPAASFFTIRVPIPGWVSG
jgi:hypothetical protein